MNKLCVFLLFCFATSSWGQIAIYGGEKQDVFLGYLSQSMFAINSIWNDGCEYGRDQGANSIWNEYGKYGSSTSDYSPWNERANYPPVLKNGSQSLGYFTTNRYKTPQTKDSFAIDFIRNFNKIKKNKKEWYNSNVKK
ncbi:MAG: hypothetical protein LBE34_14810 [Flavobacteriaceae bacterium]|jgi:hypothetical protein|nr:hypothetical protein [Flavobacteriaceae bacterium]